MIAGHGIGGGCGLTMSCPSTGEEASLSISLQGHQEQAGVTRLVLHLQEWVLPTAMVRRRAMVRYHPAAHAGARRCCTCVLPALLFSSFPRLWG